MTHYFRNPRFNFDAEQSIVATFRSIDEAEQVSHGACGGGGPCGALLAACNIRPDLEDILLDEFRVEAAAVTCREIIKARELSCADCVALAEELLIDYLEEEHPVPKAAWWVNFEAETH